MKPVDYACRERDAALREVENLRRQLEKEHLLVSVFSSRLKQARDLLLETNQMGLRHEANRGWLERRDAFLELPAV